VLVTRPAHQAGSLCALIERRGAIALRLPTVEIAPPQNLPALKAVLSRLDQFDIAVFVSPATEGLAPTKQGARIRYQGGKPLVLDGPFAETKELVAGYAILDLPSKQAAIDWAIRFGEVVRVNEVEIREIPTS
jgi:hypothetical protein